MRKRVVKMRFAGSENETLSDKNLLFEEQLGRDFNIFCFFLLYFINKKHMSR